MGAFMGGQHAWHLDAMLVTEASVAACAKSMLERLGSAITLKTLRREMEREMSLADGGLLCWKDAIRKVAVAFVSVDAHE